MRGIAATIVFFWLTCVAALGGFVFTPPALQTNGIITNFFVNASTGNDSNPGTQVLPWLTLHKVNNTVFAFGNTISLQGSFSGGDNGLIFTTSNAPSGGVTIQSYGAGATITSGNSTACVSATSLPSMVIQNLTCIGGSDTVSTTEGIRVWNNLASSLAGPTVSGTTVSGYGTKGIWIGAFGGAGTGFNGITVSNNTVHDVGGNANLTVGILVEGPDHTTNINQNATIQGNTVFNVPGLSSGTQQGGNGIILKNTTTGTIQNNLIHDNGTSNGSCPGPVGLFLFWDNGITVQFNEVYNQSQGTGCDGEGIDLDIGVVNSIVQYNYSHGNQNSGYSAFPTSTGGAWDNNIFRYNISENNGSKGGCEFSILLSNQNVTNLQVYNNTFIANSAIAVCDTGSAGATWAGIVKNNIIDSAGGAQNINVNAPGSLTFDHNDYPGASTNFHWNGVAYTSFAAYKSGASQDANSITTSPSFSGNTFVGTCGVAPPQPCPINYKLNTVSALIGVGQSIASPGAQDYYGNAVPSAVGTGYNIGAFGAGVGTTTFDPGNTVAGATLSNNNLTVTFPTGGANTYGTSRVSNPHSTGKYYFELTYTHVGCADGLNGECGSAGVQNASAGISSIAPGQDANMSVACYNATSTAAGWFVNNVTTNDCSTIVALGDVFGFAVDLTNGLIWSRNVTRASSTWNAGGSANPATGVGGHSISAITPCPCYAAVWGYLLGAAPAAAFTANFGTRAYGATAPTGFGNW